MLGLRGKIVTFDPGRPVVDQGVLYVGEDGRIGAIVAAGDDPPEPFASVEPIDTEGVLYPGLIDLHNHILYNLRSLWSPVGRTEPYTTHNQWPGAHDYSAEITAPARVWSTSPAAKEVLAFAEAKAIVGGTTAIQGAPGTSKPYEGFLVRNVDNETFGTHKDLVSQSVLTLEEPDLQGRAEQMTKKGITFVYHLGEGTAPGLLKEFTDASHAGCLQERLVAIHGTVLDQEQFAEWSSHAGSIVWSPFSNLWLYHDTTKVDLARDAGIRICLGSDWAPSGSKHILGELKVADLWNREHLDGTFSAQELCELVTANPADALHWTDQVGRLRETLFADVLVVDADSNEDPYRNLIESTEENVRLVLIGGKAKYGRTSLMHAAGADAAEPIHQAGRGRQISLAGGQEPMTWSHVVDSLEAVRADPQAALHHADNLRAAGEVPFELTPDMPEPTGPLERAADMANVVIPPLDTFRHDEAFFDALERDRAPILDGLLDGLRDYYRG